MHDDDCCGVTEEMCEERRRTCKDSRLAVEAVLMDSMKARDARIEKIESRFYQILVAIIVQLIAFVLLYVSYKI